MALCFEVLNKELHKFYDVNRADGPLVVAGKLFKSLADPGEKQRDEDLKYRSGLQSGVGDSLLAVMKAKDEQLEAKDQQLKAKDETIAQRDSEIERLKLLLSQNVNEDVSPPLPPQYQTHEYTYSQLLGGTIEDIEPQKKESYLSPSELSKVFEMSPAEFSSLPTWKKTARKKEKKQF